jgi:hypothetical protein
MKELLKTTEGLIVFGGLAAIAFVGKAMIIPTGIAYAAVNIPNFLEWLKKMAAKIKALVIKPKSDVDG